MLGESTDSTEVRGNQAMEQMNAATFSSPSTLSETLAQQIQEKLQELEVDSVEELREEMQEKQADMEKFATKPKKHAEAEKRFDELQSSLRTIEELQEQIKLCQQVSETTVVASSTTPAVNAEALTQQAQEQLRELEVDSIEELREEIQEKKANMKKLADKPKKRAEAEKRFNELQTGLKIIVAAQKSIGSHETDGDTNMVEASSPVADRQIHPNAQAQDEMLRHPLISQKKSFLKSVSYKKLGLEYQQIPGDGHCLYHAVALHTHSLNQEKLRNIVAAHIECNVQEFQGFIPLPKDKTIMDYISDIRNGVEWADNVEIEVLMRTLNRPILAIDYKGEIINSGDADRFEGDPIFVYFNGHNHYDAYLYQEQFTSRGREIFKQIQQEAKLPTVIGKSPENGRMPEDETTLPAEVLAESPEQVSLAREDTQPDHASIVPEQKFYQTHRVQPLEVVHPKIAEDVSQVVRFALGALASTIPLPPSAENKMFIFLQWLTLKKRDIGEVQFAGKDKTTVGDALLQLEYEGFYQPPPSEDGGLQNACKADYLLKSKH